MVGKIIALSERVSKLEFLLGISSQSLEESEYPYVLECLS